MDDIPDSHNAPQPIVPTIRGRPRTQFRYPTLFYKALNAAGLTMVAVMRYAMVNALGDDAPSACSLLFLNTPRHDMVKRSDIARLEKCAQELAKTELNQRMAVMRARLDAVRHTLSVEDSKKGQAAMVEKVRSGKTKGRKSRTKR